MASKWQSSNPGLSDCCTILPVKISDGAPSPLQTTGAQEMESFLNPWILLETCLSLGTAGLKTGKQQGAHPGLGVQLASPTHLEERVWHGTGTEQ